MKIVLGIINTAIYFFQLLLAFLIPIFDARWFDVKSLKFTAFINKLVEKNKSISSTDGFFKILLKLIRTKLFKQKYNFSVIVWFKFR